LILNKITGGMTGYLLLLSMYFITRLIGLDSDIPLGWTIIEYQIFDEMFYNLPAINLFHYGQWDVTKYGMSFVDLETKVSLPFWNLLSWLFLESGVSPLVAVRLPAVIAGAVAYTFFIVLIVEIYNRLNKEGEDKRYLMVISGMIIIYPLLDPMFYFSNVINEPTIFRLMFSIILIYIFLTKKVYTSKGAYYIGAFTCFSVLFVYLYNIFLLLFSFWMFVRNGSIKNILYYALGVLTVFIIWYFVFHQINTHSVLEALELVRSSGVKDVGLHSLFHYIHNLALLSMTNFLAYSPGLTILFVLSICSVLYILFFASDEDRAHKDNKKFIKEIIVVNLIFMITYLIQSYFISDQVSRKGIILYFSILVPVFVYLAYTLDTINSQKIKYRIFFVSLSALLIWLVVILTGAEGGKFFDFHRVLFSKFEYYLVFFIYVAVFMVGLFLNRSKFVRYRLYLLGLLLILVINSGYLYVHHMGKEKTFSQLVEKISRLEPGYFIGGLSHVFVSGNQEHKPFLFFYTPRFYSVKLPYYDALNSVNIEVVDNFLEQGEKVYTIVNTDEQKDRLLSYYTNSEIVLFESEFNYISTYQDLYSKTVEDGMYNYDYKKHIYVVRVKQ